MSVAMHIAALLIGLAFLALIGGAVYLIKKFDGVTAVVVGLVLFTAYCFGRSILAFWGIPA